MIERILELVSEFWEIITPIFVVDQTEKGIIKRLGRFKRDTKTGLNYKIPLIETYETEMTVITTLGLNSQTLTTKDGQSVVISAIIKYAIEDVKPYLLKIYDSEDVLADTTMGEIKEQVSKVDYVDLSAVEKKILSKVRRSVKEYGVKIHTITFVDMGRVRSIRLLQE